MVARRIPVIDYASWFVHRISHFVDSVSSCDLANEVGHVVYYAKLHGSNHITGHGNMLIVILSIGLDLVLKFLLFSQSTRF